MHEQYSMHSLPFSNRVNLYKNSGCIEDISVLKHI